MESTAAQAIASALAAEGVDTVVGIPGTHNLGVWDALADMDDIRTVVPRHEDGGAMISNGYARASGRPGVFLAAAGPGVTNTLTALNTAYVDSVPMLLLATELSTTVAGRQLGYIHDINDQLGVMSHVAGWAVRIPDGGQAAPTVHAAMARLRSERPRPIVVEAPTDVLDQPGSDDVGPIHVAGRGSDPEAVLRAARLLQGARHPVILAGGGAVAAADKIVELAERLAAPVLTTSMGLGIVPDDHPLSVGSGFDLADSFLGELRAADVVLVVGTRFTQYVTRAGKLAIPGRIIQIDIDIAEIGKVYPAELALLGHADVILGQLGEVLAVDRRDDASYRIDVSEEKGVRRDALREAFPLEMGLVDSVVGSLPRDAILGCDMTGLAYWIRRVGIAYRPRSILYPVINAGLGTGLPFAIGAKLAYPDRPVVAVAGDAGFQFNVQELATAVELGMAFPIVIVNDNGFQALRPRQTKVYGRAVNSDLANPDFAALARAYGAEGQKVAADELGAAVTAALQAGRMTVIEVPAVMKHPEAVGPFISTTPSPLSRSSR